MKKIIAILLSAALLLCICTSCAGKEEAAEPAAQPEAQQETEDENFAGMANPVVDSDADSIMNELGVAFNVPEGAENVTYYIISSETAQMCFTLDGAEVTARIKSDVAFNDISGMYYTEGSEEDADIGYNGGKVLSYSEGDVDTKICLWYDIVPGLMYSVSAEGPTLDNFDIVDVAKQTYIPTQGEVDGDEDADIGNEEPEVGGLVNPMAETDAEGLMNTLGFSFNEPEEAEDIQYFTINDEIGEMRFTFNTVSITARIKSDVACNDISGMNYVWEDEEECSVSGLEGTVQSAVDGDNTVQLCLWYDVVPGLMYSVSAVGQDLDGFDIVAIAEAVYAPAQGEVG